MNSREKFLAVMNFETGRLLRKGGYIPHIDHAVSEDVTWENFRYYRTRLNDICDKAKQYSFLKT
jgi:hypothetical protein